MNTDAFRENVHQIIGGISLQRDDLLMIAVVVSICSLMIALIALARSKRGGIGAIPGFDRLTGIQSRVDKLELLFSEIKLSTTKQADQIKGDFQFVRRDIDDIRKIMKYASESKQKKEAAPQPVAETPSAEPIKERDPRLSRTPTELDIQRYADLIDEEIEDSGAKETSTEKKTEKSAPVVALVPDKPEKLGARLKKTRIGLFERIKNVFTSSPKLDAAMLDEVEALLIGADLGVKTVQTLIAEVKEELQRGEVVTEESFKAMLKMRILSVLESDIPLLEIEPRRRESGPLVVLVVGVNGVGKTTTIAKLAKRWNRDGTKVMLVAADTFRAAAVEQLVTWGERIGVPVVRGNDEAKPAAVVFDGMKRALAENVDVVIIDTAGRLHNKSNLMAELEGIRNSIERHQSDAPHEVLLVLDGATGQNALNQAREFNEAVNLTGLAVTKLDGTPKGGIIVAIKQELKIPIRYIGVGEGMEDLRSFSPREFVEALFVSSEDAPQSGTFAEEGELSHNAQVRRRRRT